jgi:hypothetical protein
MISIAANLRGLHVETQSAMIRNMRGTAAASDPSRIVFCQAGDIDSRHCGSGLRNRLSGPRAPYDELGPVSRSGVVEAGSGPRCRRAVRVD